ncbi:MAG: exo-alpha-sialidase [Candidatus Hydrogenedentes bacterium]|nr:exo-alpha-sialidase [Candidatus Hydrogenedentota bacterium]
MLGRPRNVHVLVLIPFVTFGGFPQQALAVLGFSEPVALNSTAGGDGTAADNTPDIASDGNGNWVAVWSSFNSLGNTIGTDSDILVSTSTDNGSTWSATEPLNSNAADDAGSDSNPVVATNGAGVWIATWVTTDSFEDTIGTDGNILFSRSLDNGATWSEVEFLNSNADSDTGADAMPCIANDGGLNWIIAWHSNDTLGNTVGPDNDILFSRSSDGGVTWTNVATLNSNAGTDIGLDANVSVATDKAGNWIAVWETNDPFGNTVGTDYDIFFARSSNNGQTWSAMAPLNSNAAGDTGNDRSPRVAADTAGNCVAVWHSNDTLGGTVGSDNDIFTTSSSDSGATWEPVKALNPNADADTVADLNASVVSDNAGNWLVVWHGLQTARGGDYDVFASASSNDGAAWSEVAVLYQGAEADIGNDRFARTATDGAGNWAVVWESTNSLGNTIGADNDILISISDAVSVNGLTLLAPNGGERWKHDTKRKILWSTTGNVGERVQLILLRNGLFVSQIKAKTKNDGKLNWLVPANAAPGSGYQIRIVSKDDPNISDESDASFRIKSAE